jgi:hypothetical protein
MNLPFIVQGKNLTEVACFPPERERERERGERERPATQGIEVVSLRSIGSCATVLPVWRTASSFWYTGSSSEFDAIIVAVQFRLSSQTLCHPPSMLSMWIAWGFIWCVCVWFRDRPFPQWSSHIGHESMECRSGRDLGW